MRKNLGLFHLAKASARAHEPGAFGNAVGSLFPESSFLRLHKLCLTKNMSSGFQEQHLMYKAPVLFFLHYLFGLFTCPPFLLPL